MNKDRRKAIEAIRGKIEDLRMQSEQLAQEVQDILDEEQEYLDNMPESLQGGDRGQAAEEAISNLESAVKRLVELESIIDELKAAGPDGREGWNALLNTKQRLRGLSDRCGSRCEEDA